MIKTKTRLLLRQDHQPWLTTDHPTPRLETGIVQQNIKRKEQRTLDDIDLDDIDNWLDNQTAIEYKPRKKSNHIENMLDPQMMTNGKQDEDTKVLDFLPGTKPELVDIGETIRFMHLTKESAWSLGTEVELATMKKDSPTT